MKWEVVVVVFLVLTLAVEAIVTLRPVPQGASLEPDQDDSPEEPATPMASNHQTWTSDRAAGCSGVQVSIRGGRPQGGPVRLER